MKKLSSPHWPLILGLGALALVRPLVRILADQLGWSIGPVVPLIITVVVGAVWILVVGLADVLHPVTTLTVTGLVYALASILISGVSSPILTGELQGPLSQPLAIIPVLGTNVVWGLLAGLCAWALQQRGRSRTTAR